MAYISDREGLCQNYTVTRPNICRNGNLNSNYPLTCYAGVSPKDEPLDIAILPADAEKIIKCILFSEHLCYNSIKDIPGGDHLKRLIYNIVSIFSATAVILGVLSGCKSEVKTVSSDGFAAAIYSDHAEITGVATEAEEISIPSKIKGKPVTAVAEGVFSGLPIVSIAMPDTVTDIGKAAFANCNNLKTVTLSQSLTAIPDNAFFRCISLSSINLPDSIACIGENAFYECNKLTVESLPKSLATVGPYAFAGCTGISKILLPDSVLEIGNGAFEGASGLTEFSSGKGLKKIGNNTFGLCTALKSVTLCDGLLEIGNAAFAETAVESIDIPDTVTVLGGCFSGCKELVSAKLPSGITSIPDDLFSGCGNLSETVLPSGITSIGNSAFKGCGRLSAPSMPEGIISVGDEAFSQCMNFDELYFSDSLQSVGANSFSGCVNLKTLQLGSSLKSIGDGAFSSMLKIRYITLPSSVENVGEGIFKSCSLLRVVTILKEKDSLDTSSWGVGFSITWRPQ